MSPLLALVSFSFSKELNILKALCSTQTFLFVLFSWKYQESGHGEKALGVGKHVPLKDLLE